MRDYNTGLLLFLKVSYILFILNGDILTVFYFIEIYLRTLNKLYIIIGIHDDRKLAQYKMYIPQEVYIFTIGEWSLAGHIDSSPVISLP